MITKPVSTTTALPLNTVSLVRDVMRYQVISPIHPIMLRILSLLFIGDPKTV